MTMPAPSENMTGWFHGTCPHCHRQFDIETEFWNVTRHGDQIFGDAFDDCPFCDEEIVEEDFLIAEKDFG